MRSTLTSLGGWIVVCPEGHEPPGVMAMICACKPGCDGVSVGYHVGGCPWHGLEYPGGGCYGARACACIQGVCVHAFKALGESRLRLCTLFCHRAAVTGIKRAARDILGCRKTQSCCSMLATVALAAAACSNVWVARVLCGCHPRPPGSYQALFLLPPLLFPASTPFLLDKRVQRSSPSLGWHCTCA